MNTFQELQRREIKVARTSHKPINSAHEGYAIILEEMDEFWQEVCKKRSERSPDRMVEELVQIAAMAQRTAEDVLMSNDQGEPHGTMTHNNQKPL
jgi:hypothetical protein